MPQARPAREQQPGAALLLGSGRPPVGARPQRRVGVLQQLGKLATYSHELFTDLTIEAEGSLTRINQLKGRLGRVTERLARVDDALAAASETEIANICAANPGGAAR